MSACAEGEDFTHRRYRYKDTVDEEERAKNKTKCSVRAKVEHPFLIIKRIFGFVTTRARRATILDYLFRASLIGNWL